MNADADAASLLAAIDAELDAIDAALRRLDEGSYGRCARCGAVLADDVLDRDPLATVCPAPCG